MSAKDWLEVDGFALHPPSTPAMISEAEARLGITFPKDLRDLLLTADGVFDCAGEYDVFWPLVRIVQENLTAWEFEGLARTQWLGFGDDGTGSPFCVSTLGGTRSGRVVTDRRGGHDIGRLVKDVLAWLDQWGYSHLITRTVKIPQLAGAKRLRVPADRGGSVGHDQHHREGWARSRVAHSHSPCHRFRRPPVRTWPASG